MGRRAVRDGTRAGKQMPEHRKRRVSQQPFSPGITSRQTMHITVDIGGITSRSLLLDKHSILGRSHSHPNPTPPCLPVFPFVRESCEPCWKWGSTGHDVPKRTQPLEFF